jgi:hypothetical protein
MSPIVAEAEMITQIAYGFTAGGCDIVSSKHMYHQLIPRHQVFSHVATLCERNRKYDSISTTTPALMTDLCRR